MIAAKPKRKKKWLRWLILITAFYLCLWGGINLILNIPFIRAYIIAKVQESTGVTIQEAGWVYIGATGNLSLAYVAVTTVIQDNPVTISLGSLTIKYVGFHDPYVQVKNLSTPWGSINLGDIHILGELTQPHFSITANQVELDGEAIFALSGGENNSSETIENPVDSLQVKNSFIRLPWLAKPVRFDLDFQQQSNGTADGRLTVFSSALSSVLQSGSIRTAITWNQFPVNIQSVKGRMDSFAWNEPSTAMEGIISGSYEITQQPDGGFSFYADHILQNASYTGQWQSSSMRMESVGLLDESYFPLSATVSIQHQDIHDASFGMTVPPGSIISQWIYNSSHEQEAVIQIQNSELGSVYASANGNLYEATSTINTKMEWNALSIASLLNRLPADWRMPDVEVDGILSASASMRFHDQTVQRYQLSMQAHSLDVVYPAITITDTTIEANAAGNANTHNATFTIHPKEFAVSAIHSSLIIPLEPFTVSGNYDPASNQYEIHSSPIPSEWWDELLLTYNSGGNYTATMSTSAEKILQPIMANFVPNITRTFEGTGDIILQLEGSPSGIHIETQSDDLALFSLDEEPFIGAQLRSITANYTLQDWTKTSASIQAATPYFLYGDMELELPGDEFSVSVNSDDQSGYVIALKLPHNGTIAGTYHEDGAYDLKWKSADLQTVILPVLEKYLQTDLSLLSSAKGSANGWLQSGSETIKGEVDFNLTEWRRDEPPEMGVQNAAVSIPFAYPLQTALFPKDHIHFEAETVMWQDSFYENIQAELLLSDEAIRLPVSLILPLFGGEFHADQLAFLDWQSGFPTVAGDIQILNMDMKQANELFPYFGSEGTLSLHATEIVWRDDRFSLEGSVSWNAFSGSIAIQDVFYQPDTRQFGMSMYLLDVDLEQLSRFLNYGKLTGKLSGHIRDLLIQFPEPGEKGIPKPIAFDLELKSKEKKEQIISGATLKKLMELGSATVPFQQELYSREFKYAGLGLRGIHSATQTQLYGTLKDNYFIEPSGGLFADKVGIRMQVEKNEAQTRNMDFDRIWDTLLNQMGE